MKFIPQFIPYWDESEKKAVRKVLEHDYLNEHKTVREFEKRFSEFVGAKYCITCTSGTTAIYLALKSVYDKTITKNIYNRYGLAIRPLGTHWITVGMDYISKDKNSQFNILA